MCLLKRLLCAAFLYLTDIQLGFFHISVAKAQHHSPAAINCIYLIEEVMWMTVFPMYLYEAAIYINANTRHMLFVQRHILPHLYRLFIVIALQQFR